MKPSIRCFRTPSHDHTGAAIARPSHVRSTLALELTPADSHPLVFGRPTWEFGTAAATFSDLPLILLGFAGLVAAGLALSKRRLIVTMGMVLWVMFGVAKTIAKTSLLAVASAVACFLGASAAVRHTRKKVRG
jgi:hypothetical protein